MMDDQYIDPLDVAIGSIDVAPPINLNRDYNSPDLHKQYLQSINGGTPQPQPYTQPVQQPMMQTQVVEAQQPTPEEQHPVYFTVNGVKCKSVGGVVYQYIWKVVEGARVLIDGVVTNDDKYTVECQSWELVETEEGE